MNSVNESVSEPTLLFIPDISGFTKFVHDTEIVHSEHIIRELLETIIDANEMGLQVSEIEGDAILFYRTGKEPTAAETLAQVQRMYTKFHSALRKYETQRICQCGACANSNGLKLKFVIHYGDISVNQVKSRSNLFGKDLIVAHRLLKNEIPLNEYVLITDQLISACSTWVDIGQVSWDDLKKGQGDYDFGTVKYCFLSLAPLEKHIPQPSIEDYAPNPNTNKALTVESVINAPLDLVFDVVSDPYGKHLWVLTVKGSDQHNGAIVKNGVTHRCIMNEDDSDPSFTSHSFNINRDKITWIDTNHTLGADNVITLDRIGNQLTRINITVFKNFNPLQKLIFNLTKKKGFEQFFSGSLENLNIYCKELVEKGEKHSAGILLEPAT